MQAAQLEAVKAAAVEPEPAAEPEPEPEPEPEAEAEAEVAEAESAQAEAEAEAQADPELAAAAGGGGGDAAATTPHHANHPRQSGICCGWANDARGVGRCWEDPSENAFPEFSVRQQSVTFSIDVCRRTTSHSISAATVISHLSHVCVSPVLQI